MNVGIELGIDWPFLFAEAVASFSKKKLRMTVGSPYVICKSKLLLLLVSHHSMKEIFSSVRS